MPRPKTKQELIRLGHTNYEKLLTFIVDLPKEKRKAKFPSQFLNRNIRDVLAHLHHSILMLLSWYEQAMKGEKPEMPALSYTWRTVPDLNKEINKKYKNVPLNEIEKLLDTNYQKVQKLIEGHSNGELFEKLKYQYTGTTSLGAYIVSGTSSHYERALKLIKKCIK